MASLPKESLMIVKKDGLIKDVWVMQESYHRDKRGYTFTTYSDAYNLPCQFVLDKVITGRKGSLRGFHGDNDTWKLFTCLSGSVRLVLLDMRPGDTYQKTEAYELNKKNRVSVLVPPGVFNAHQGNNNYVLHYKWSKPYDISKQDTIKWNVVKWPHKPILSERDEQAKTIKEYVKCYG